MLGGLTRGLADYAERRLSPHDSEANGSQLSIWDIPDNK